ncbi:MAG: hypothetical protein KAX55_05830 [Propionivibrio sp.]|nr:hypothetical protein [Propionivibrio sp.]
MSGFRRYAILVVAGLVLAACGSKVSLENYGKLRTGQSYEDVTQILGDLARCDEILGIRTCVWGDEQRGINVNFVAGQVMLLSAKNLK